ncbi:MAG: OmpA/MotB domain protein [Bacteroidetes bacterium]|nr:OmpA/MotB domain protein [Bacteroidota bacterium]
MMCCIGTFLSINIQAQEKGHYLFFSAGMGPEAIKCQMKNGNEVEDVGYTLTAGYDYFFCQNWGVETGLGIQTFRTQMTLSDMAGYPAIDKSGATYEYRNYFNGWQEKQNVTLLSVPVGIRCLFPFYDHLGVTASTGLKLLLPFSTMYTITDGSITTTGYYNSTSVELINQPQNGFTTINQGPSGKISLGLSYACYADIGIVCQLTPIVSMNVSTYLDYGPSNWISSSTKPVYQVDGTYNGIMHSDRIKSSHFLNYGVKFGLSWYLGDRFYRCHCTRD